MPLNRLGIAAVVASNLLFGLIYLYSSFMQPMQGTDVFAWRMVAMLVALTVLMSINGGWDKLRQFAARIGKRHAALNWLLLAASSAVVAGNFWIFTWAPVNGYGIDVAVGYFLLPLTTLLMGLAVFGERLNRLQKWAVACASVGVAHEVWAAQSLSWVTLFCCLSYPFYYGIRRHLQVPALIGLWLDLLLITPFAVAYLAFASDSFALMTGIWYMTPLLISLGLFSALAMVWMMYGARTLPFSLFSMLSYIEPILLFIIAIAFMNAPLTASAMWTYGFVWLGLMLMMGDGWRKLRLQKYAAAPKAAETA